MKTAAMIAMLAGLSLSALADKINYGQLPQSVQKTLSATKGSDPIKEIERQVQDGKTVYEVELDRPGLNTKLWLAEDGSIIRDARNPVDQLPRSEPGFLPPLTRIPSLQISDVPDPVQKTVEQQAAGRAVADIDRETWNGKTVYEVEFAQAGRNAQIHVAEDGTIVRDERTEAGLKSLFMGTQLEDTPPAVQETIMREAGNRKIADIDKERRTGEVIYEVEFKEPGRNIELHIAENGTIVRDSRKAEAIGAPARQAERGIGQSSKPNAEKLTFGEVPAAVQNRIRTTDEASKVKQIHRTTKDGLTLYEVELEKDGKSTTLHINSDGTILEEKR